MNNLVVRYRIRTNRGGGVVAGNYISVFWDDVGNAFVVHQFDDENDTTGSVMSSGPDLGADRHDHEPVTPVVPIPYSFCAGSDLQTFTRKSTFPYANKISTPNHFSCVSQVCDLRIDDRYTVQQATDFVTSDGAFQVTATSSNGPIRYSLSPSFNYATEGQDSGLFAGLLPGTYTVTAKDALGCVDQLEITVPVTDVYNVKYFLEYEDLNDVPSKVEILERGYEGDPIEVKGGADPFVLNMGGDAGIDKFDPINPSFAKITLISPTNFYFRDLFTQDERKYLVKYFKDYGNSLPGFTPAELPALSTWTNIDDGETNWTTGATPSFTGAIESNRITTPYAFEAGREYTFGYQFTRSSLSATWLVVISLVDENEELVSIITQHYAAFPSFGITFTISGSFTFTAPSRAAGIAIRVVKTGGGSAVGFRPSDGSVTITSFVNNTPSEAADPGGYELKWLGYSIANNYSEPYVNEPYPVTITATDGLADLKNYDFADKFDNLYRDDLVTINAIADILAKTDLGINIQTVINRFETEMDTEETDDPTAQCMFGPETFYHDGQVKNCFEALSEILRPFGAVIRQRLGKWFIAHPEELVDEAPYREFDSKGVLVGNGTVEDIVDIKCSADTSRAVMEASRPVLEVIPAYGKLYFEHTLLKRASLIKSYSFEPEDVYTAPGGNKLFTNWNVNILNAPGATYGIKETKALEGDYNFFLKYLLLRGSGTNVSDGVSVLSAPVVVEYEDVDAFEFRFSYATLLTEGSFGEVYYTKIKWMLKIGDYYYNQNGGWTTDINQKYNEVYVERFNEVLEKKVTALFRDVPALIEETAQVEFILCNAFVYDFEDTTALKATPTTTKPIGTRMKVRVSPSIMNYYILVEKTDEEEDEKPGDQIPNDYADTTNERIWELEHEGVASRGREVEYIYLDNVVLLHFPNGAEPPEDITIERTNNAGIKVDFEQAYLLNDIDTENINNSERTYKNFFKRLDGTPTEEWQRTYREGKGKLLDLLSNDVMSQYKTPSNKITGSMRVDREVLPTSILRETNDNNRLYKFMGYTYHDKSAAIDFDIVEIKDTVTDPDSEEIDAGFTTGFSLGFRS